MKFTCFLSVFLVAFAVTLQAAAAPATQPGRSVEICFVLDTTGSMGGLIEGAKQKIWLIANDVVVSKPKPQSIRVALIGYRDRGDVYVTQRFDLTDDIDTVYKNLQTFEAGGGGDEPESVNQALDEAVGRITWSTDDRVLKMIFLVGDAPPHMDYADDVKYPDSCQKAVKNNILINTVQCGSIVSTTPIWQDIARRSEGSFVRTGQTGDMVQISTPMDSELADLNRQMGKTLVPFGVEGEYRESVGKDQAAKQMASETAAAPAMADRLSFNNNSGKAVQGNDELIDALASKRVNLSDLKDNQLPPDLRALSPADRDARVQQLTRERVEIAAKITAASRRREDYVAAELKKRAAADKTESFDVQVSRIIQEQKDRRSRE